MRKEAIYQEDITIKTYIPNKSTKMHKAKTERIEGRIRQFNSNHWRSPQYPAFNYGQTEDQQGNRSEQHYNTTGLQR